MQSAKESILSNCDVKQSCSMSVAPGERLLTLLVVGLNALSLCLYLETRNMVLWSDSPMIRLLNGGVTGPMFVQPGGNVNLRLVSGESFLHGEVAEVTKHQDNRVWVGVLHGVNVVG